MCRAEVELLAVRTPSGEHLQLVIQFGDNAHLILIDIIKNQVALRVLHLNLVQVFGVEGLTSLVGGESDEVVGRMPCRIDACAEGLICFEIHLPQFAIGHNHRTAKTLTHVEEHVVGLEVLVGVAVDALTDILCAN